MIQDFRMRCKWFCAWSSELVSKLSFLHNVFKQNYFLYLPQNWHRQSLPNKMERFVFWIKFSRFLPSETNKLATMVNSLLSNKHLPSVFWRWTELKCGTQEVPADAPKTAKQQCTFDFSLHNNSVCDNTNYKSKLSVDQSPKKELSI